MLLRRGYLPLGGAPYTFDPDNRVGGITLSNGNLTATDTMSSVDVGARGIVGRLFGKYYCEFHVDSLAGDTWGMGVGTSGACLGGGPSAATFVGGTGGLGIGRWQTLIIYNNTNLVTGLTALAAGQNVCMAVDIDNQAVWWRVDAGNWNDAPTADPATNTNGQPLGANMAGQMLYPWVDFEAINNAATANFGATAYAQTPPVGFGNWS